MRVIGSSWWLFCSKILVMVSGSVMKLFLNKMALLHTLTGAIWILLTSKLGHFVH